MKVLIATLLTIFSLNTLVLDVVKVREAFKAAGQDKTKVDYFYKLMQDVNANDGATLLAYKAASIALKAKYAKKIKNKKQGFIEGVTLLDNIIKHSPNAIEPRLIRLSIQENSPKLLKYKGEIEEDKAFIMKHYDGITSKSLKNHIKDYILQSKSFTKQEKTVILAQ